LHKEEKEESWEIRWLQSCGGDQRLSIPVAELAQKAPEAIYAQYRRIGQIARCSSFVNRGISTACGVT
jgi:hypothetical protein